MTNESATIPESGRAAPSELAYVASIAVIDDAFRPFCIAQVPERDRDSVRAMLDDPEVLFDLLGRGYDHDRVRTEVDNALDALTLPEFELDLAFAKLSGISTDAAKLLESRHTMRQFALHIRNTTQCEVVELPPEAELSDIQRFDVVFLDYYLNGGETDGERAERIASEIQARRQADRRQQLVLMSSRERVRDMRTAFRQRAGIVGPAFAFVAKKDLDERWKVRAHLEMLSRAIPHADALGNYIQGLKRNVEAARDQLSTALDDLDIGDFAYIQRVALHEDGHPLGDYLSWLFSSHLTALAFEGDLRSAQRDVDAMEFRDGPLSSAEPSINVVNLYHDALFARNLGKLEGHPRAQGSAFKDIPLVQLGDVFLDKARTAAVVVLSADCDLAFSTAKKRHPDPNRSVIIISGIPSSIKSESGRTGSAHTEGMMADAEVYRIDWHFETFRTVRLEDLVTVLKEQGLDLENRDRLRSLYALKLQQEFGNHLLRIGPPIMPPISRRLSGSIKRGITGAETSDEKLDDGGVVAARFGKSLSLRLTPSLVAKLKEATSNLAGEMEDHLELLPQGNGAAEKRHTEWSLKTTAVREQLGNDALWMGLLNGIDVPSKGEVKKIRGSIYLANGSGWSFPNAPAVVLALKENEQSEVELQDISDEKSLD
jgi:hypothetical protein